MASKRQPPRNKYTSRGLERKELMLNQTSVIIRRAAAQPPGSLNPRRDKQRSVRLKSFSISKNLTIIDIFSLELRFDMPLCETCDSLDLEQDDLTDYGIKLGPFKDLLT